MFNRIKLTNAQNKNNASFGKRTLAFIIDLIIVNILIISQFTETLSKYFNKSSFTNAFTHTLDNSEIILPMKIYLMIFIMMTIVLLYFAFFEYYLGQTPGKMIIKIKVVEFDIDGSQKTDITFWRSLARNCFVIPFFPFYIFWITEPLYTGLYGEGLLDKWTNTATINEDTKFEIEEYKLNKV